MKKKSTTIVKDTTHHLSDKELLEQSTTKPWLFSILVGRYQPAFLRKSRAVVHSPELAEDVVQDTFLKIYKNAHQFSEVSGASFKSWAYKILLNTAYTALVRQRRESLYVNYMDTADIDMIDVSVTDDGVASDRQSLVRSVLARMPARVSRLLQQYFIDGKSQKEIADSEHISAGAVRVRMHRAKKLFKKYFKSSELSVG